MPHQEELEGVTVAGVEDWERILRQLVGEAVTGEVDQTLRTREAVEGAEGIEGFLLQEEIRRLGGVAGEIEEVVVGRPLGREVRREGGIPGMIEVNLLLYFMRCFCLL